MSTLPGYYELEPENNHFTDVTADVTHQCNMNCSNCYIPNRDVADMNIDRLINTIRRFPKRTMIRIMGAEPTMRKPIQEANVLWPQTSPVTVQPYPYSDL